MKVRVNAATKFLCSFSLGCFSKSLSRKTIGSDWSMTFWKLDICYMPMSFLSPNHTVCLSSSGVETLKGDCAVGAECCSRYLMTRRQSRRQVNATSQHWPLAIVSLGLKHENHSLQLVSTDLLSTPLNRWSFKICHCVLFI